MNDKNLPFPTDSRREPCGPQTAISGSEIPIAVGSASAEQPSAGWSPARLAYWFYGTAATGAVIGQTWVAVIHVPWPASVPLYARVAAVLPFALCLELLAMALAAMADDRMQRGERAYGFRIFSAIVATVAVGILIAGHWPHLYWSAGFGVLSTSAYMLWVLHSAARRRDAQRAAGKLADTAPDYGLWRRVRHPIRTARAAELARAGCIDAVTGAWRPLSLYESLHATELAVRDEKRRPAIAHAVEQVVRADHDDPRMAEIAVHTLDLDRLAAELAQRVDYRAWAQRLAPAITAPLPTPIGDDPDPASPQQPFLTITDSALPPSSNDPDADQALDDDDDAASPDLAAAVASASEQNASPDTPAETESAGRPAASAELTVPSEQPPTDTAAAVAYWSKREPGLSPDELAAKIGKSARTVRRHLPATDNDPRRRRRTATNRSAHQTSQPRAAAGPQLP